MRVVQWIAGLGLVGIAVWICVLIAVHSGDPHHYYKYRDADALPEYPISDVVTWLGIVAGQVVVELAILVVARRTSLAVRLVAVAVVCGTSFVVGIPFAMMHAPPYSGANVVYSVFAAPWAVVMAVVAAIVARVRGSSHI